ncbi:MAG: PKD domain-containing protein [Salinivirgaceae bacterium]|nr:PKD domain-containing protein [Salinivirgaceae bacterium]
MRDIEGLVAWFSADSVHLTDDGHVDILYDKSGNSRHAVQNTVGKQPICMERDSSINYQRTLYFDGNDFFTSSFGQSISQPSTIVVLWQQLQSNASTTCYTGLSSTSRNQLYLSKNKFGLYAGLELNAKNVSTTTFKHSIFFSLFNGNNSFLAINNHITISGNVGGLASDGLIIGSYISNKYGIVGNITELIFINNTLSVADSSVIMDYLRDKYAPAVSLKEFNSSYGFKPMVFKKPWLTSLIWNDGYTDSIRVFSHNGFYKVTATDIFGFTSSDSAYISIVEPNALTDTTICLGDTITWNTNLAGPYTYLWSNGSTDPSLNISSGGQYWVVITDTAGYSWHSDIITVTVDSFPVQATLGPDTIRACVGNYIYLANGYESATSYLWSTGDTTNHFEIFESGLYSVSVVNNLGCRAIDTAYYHVEGIAPTVNFSYDSLCQTRNIKFTNLSHSNDESPISTFNWWFGNGDSSVQQNPEYTFQSSGNFEIKLMVECQNGCANEVRKSLTVWQLPTADFVPDAVCSDTETQLFSRSKSPDDTISLWQWTIGGIGYSEVNPKLQFADAGKVGVTLAVATAHGCTDTISKTIVVRKGPQADFNVGPVCVDAPISLTNATINYLNLAVDYKWEIDDTDFSNMRNAELVLNDTEPHKVVMTVRQHSNGCESSVHKTLQAKSRPNVGFDVNDVCANSLPKLIAAQGNNVEQLDCVWTIDTLPKIFGKSAQLINLKEGPHAITLVATDEVGCHDTASAIFNVLPDVQATFVADVAEGAVPLVVTFKNTTTQNSEFNWDFGDGYFATERNVQHTFADSGVFNVTLTSTTPNGCVTKAEKQISTRVAHSNLAIALAKANVVTDYIEIEATLINKGTVDEHNVLINCTNNLGLDITEALPDTIFAHKVYQHKLNARLNSRDLQNLEFVCLSIKSDNTDEDETDNEFCISFTDNRFVVLQPKPNPATDHVNIEFVTQDGGNAQLAVYNANGKQIMSKEVVAESGIMRIKIDVSTLPTGNYVCMLCHNGHVSKQMFVVMRGK